MLHLKIAMLTHFMACEDTGVHTLPDLCSNYRYTKRTAIQSIKVSNKLIRDRTVFGGSHLSVLCNETASPGGSLTTDGVIAW